MTMDAEDGATVTLRARSRPTPEVERPGPLGRDGGHAILLACNLLTRSPALSTSVR